MPPERTKEWERTNGTQRFFRRLRMILARMDPPVAAELRAEHDGE
jgi:hypothetical protein